MLDNKEHDDKLIAVLADTLFSDSTMFRFKKEARGY
jgi:hypothetical protein